MKCESSGIAVATTNYLKKVKGNYCPSSQNINAKLLELQIKSQTIYKNMDKPEVHLVCAIIYSHKHVFNLFATLFTIFELAFDYRFGK